MELYIINNDKKDNQKLKHGGKELKQPIFLS